MGGLSVSEVKLMQRGERAWEEGRERKLWLGCLKKKGKEIKERSEEIDNRG